jgi:hypothetical protein
VVVSDVVIGAVYYLVFSQSVVIVFLIERRILSGTLQLLQELCQPVGNAVCRQFAGERGTFESQAVEMSYAKMLQV